MKLYLNESRKLRYSFLMVLPLLLIYEFEAFRLNNSDIAGIRNNADVLVKQLFLYFGLRGHLAVAFLLCLFMLIAYRKERDGRVNPAYFPFMLGESIVYAIVLEPVIEKLRFFLNVSERVQFVSCLGAGVYEEFLFRLVLFSGLIWAFSKGIRHRGVTVFSAACLSSLAFSYFHYMGMFGEAFSLDSFLYRFVAGLILCTLYYLRGLGIASYTHTVYNLMVFYNLCIWKG